MNKLKQILYTEFRKMENCITVLEIKTISVFVFVLFTCIGLKITFIFFSICFFFYCFWKVIIVISDELLMNLYNTRFH